MSVGTEGESRTVMPQGTGQGFHIHAILQRERGKGVPEIMKPNMLGADGFQDTLIYPTPTE